MSEKENNAAKDKKPPCQVTFFVGNQSRKGSSTHFHESGMLIMCQQPAPLNEKMRVLLQFPGIKNPIEVEGEVVWTNMHGPADSLSPRGMGVKFLNVEREVEGLLADLAVQYEAFGSIYNCYYT